MLAAPAAQAGRAGCGGGAGPAGEVVGRRALAIRHAGGGVGRCRVAVSPIRTTIAHFDFRLP
jgi:hypothetical protein